MATLLDVLPGVQVPVAEVTDQLSQMWDGMAGARPGAPSEFRASQMNLVLHFGLATPPAEAKATFETAIEFAQRYPCRIIVLAPVDGTQKSVGSLSAKLYSQCFIGPSHREMCCCEALMLGYSTREPGHYLENQISIWLESDLPVYHWFHRVPSAKIKERYLPLVRSVRRVVFDSSVSGRALAQLPWAEVRSRDLAWARTLPVRQSLGQFLSGHDPLRLVEKLSTVTVRHLESCEGEAAALLDWTRGCLEECLRRSGSPARKLDLHLEPLEMGSRHTLEIEWMYGNRSFFRWTYRERSQTAEVAADFGAGRVSYPLHVKFLEPSQALAEALFF